jgi:hypothetical protein
MNEPFDPLLQHAEEVGLSRSVERDLRRRKAKAERQAALQRAGSGGVSFGLFTMKNALLFIAMPIVVAASMFDWYMSARGWQDLLPRIGFFAYIGAAASVGLWYVWVRRAREEFRAGNMGEGWLAATAAAAAYVICVTGVIVATATNAEEAQQAAKESRLDLAKLKADRDNLQGKLEIQDEAYWQAALGNYERQLRSHEAIAQSTYKMPNLEVEKACSGQFTEGGPVAKLNFNQIRSCVHANGGIDPHTGEAVIGLRAEIEQAQQGLESAQQDRAKLDKLVQSIQDFHLIEGDATAIALAEMFGNAFDGDQVLGWVFVVISALFLFAGGFLGDWVLERIELGRAAMKQARDARKAAQGEGVANG